MDERAQGALLLAVAGVAVRLGLSGSALDYIKPSYVPLLIASGVVIGVLGALVLARAIRALDDPHDHDEASDHGHGHDHSSAPRIAWMLAAPLFAVLLVAPPPLGAFAANRQSGGPATLGRLAAPARRGRRGGAAVPRRVRGPRAV